MGKCFSHKTNEPFSIQDLNGMEKYYSLMSKRKADVFRWLIDSEGPWETPESFLCFKQIDMKKNPVKVSNEDEIRIYAAKSKSSLYVDQKEISMNLNPVDSTLSIVSSADINKGPLVHWSSDW
jgi:hypothetical protein